ncbi:MAG: hypothetical protein LBU91_01890 [Bacteroidales bacterium]|nr:hypothetical protein [Bacteroidales bacterium]
MKKVFYIVLFFSYSLSAFAQVTSTDSARISGTHCENYAQFREAYRYYRLWLSADTLNTEALNAVARTALQLGRIKEAEDCYLKTYTLDSTNFDAGLQLARLYFQLKNYTSSLEFYQQLLQRDSANISFLKGAGNCLVQMGFLPLALNYYYAAVELNKENVSLAITLVNTYLALHKTNSAPMLLDLAMEVCDTALVYNPDSRALVQAKGIIYFLEEDYPVVDSLFTILVSEGDSSTVNLRYLGLAKYKRLLYYNAIPYFEKLYTDDATNLETVMMLASCLGKTYDRKRALSLLDEAEQLMYPTDEERYNLALYRADIYRAEGDKNASKYYWEAYKLSKKNKQVMLYRLLSFYPFFGRSLDSVSRNDYEQGLFLHVLFLREFAVTEKKQHKKPSQETQVTISISILKKYQEGMFFKGADRLRMMSPDGEISWISEDELDRLIKI